MPFNPELIQNAWLELATGYVIQARASHFYFGRDGSVKLIFPDTCPDHLVIEAISSDSNFALSEGQVYFCTLTVSGDRVGIEETHLRPIATVLPMDFGEPLMANPITLPHQRPRLMAYRLSKGDEAQSVSVVPLSATLPEANAIQIRGSDGKGMIQVTKTRDLTEGTIKIIGVPCHLRDALQLMEGSCPNLILHVVDMTHHRQFEFVADPQPLDMDGRKFALRCEGGLVVGGTLKTELCCEALP